ncbi:hypothetical protein [Vandammella animalimorsus]|uniref:hypothetical protein n=1 Tax=Vandammella animalimorsus TaxID=2029117 RepID=UPI0015532AF4|nr:hypothetical protein [Vandammella animalimorsus]
MTAIYQELRAELEDLQAWVARNAVASITDKQLHFVVLAVESRIADLRFKIKRLEAAVA